jgi:hypothetical protein
MHIQNVHHVDNQCTSSLPLLKETHTHKMFNMLTIKVPILFPDQRKHTRKNVQHVDNQGRVEFKALCAIIVQKHVVMVEFHLFKKLYQK